MMEEKGKQKKERDRIGVLLYIIYYALLAASIVIIGRLIYIQYVWEPDTELESVFTPSTIMKRLDPERGNILAHDGRKLAMSCPSYDIYMDCTVMKSEFSRISDIHRSRQAEKDWLAKARELSKGLSTILGDESAEYYYKTIVKARNKGVKYQKIAQGVDRDTRNRIKKLPLFCESSYKGGYIEEENMIRQYPYGKLARRTIGFVRNNKSTAGNKYIGLEGRFNEVLHGDEGKEWLRKSDKGRVRNYDSLYVEATDGMDIRCTLDPDYQDIADKALREQIENDPEVEGGCVILMEVRSGAIRAMVNLLRDSVSHRLEESANLAIGRLGEPGSVFKTSTLMSAIEDGHVHSISETVPTNHGVIKSFAPDAHVTDWEREHRTNRMPIIEGLKVSSNYVFRYLANNYYSQDRQHFFEKIASYHLTDAFDFDLEGFARPMTPPKDTKKWSGTTLESVAIGYSICITPLHTVTFYNAIANKGKMMKPYLVEDIEKDGTIVRKLGESVLNPSICSRATADTITRGLAGVVMDGTARKLADAKCPVAGKTGTSRVVLPSGGYMTRDGRKKNQGTFVGFFPVEDPQYSIIAVVYSTLSHRDFYGSNYPVGAVKSIVNGLYDIDPYWQSVIKERMK